MDLDESGEVRYPYREAVNRSDSAGWIKIMQLETDSLLEIET